MKSQSLFASLGALALVVGGAGSSAAQSTTSGVPSVVRSHEEAVAEAAAWSEAADGILSAREQASGRRFSASLRARLRGEMSGTSLAELESFATAGARGRLPQAAGGVVTQALGGSSADLLFTPVAPCRIVNTLTAGGILAGGATRSFFVAGTTGFDTQGGNVGGCGIPDDATAVAMNIIAVVPAAAGDLRAYPYNATPVVPNASVINYDKLGALNIANGVTQPICDAAATTCTFDLIVQADVASSHVIIDVAGYYRKFPKPVDLRATFTFVNVPAATTAATLATLTFTPTVTGTVVLTGRGYCNQTQLTAGFNGINVAAGTSSALAFGTSVSDWGVVGVPAAAVSLGNFQTTFSSNTTLPVTAGVATTMSLFGRHENAATTDDCGGSFEIRQRLQ